MMGHRPRTTWYIKAKFEICVFVEIMCLQKKTHSPIQASQPAITQTARPTAVLRNAMANVA